MTKTILKIDVWQAAVYDETNTVFYSFCNTAHLLISEFLPAPLAEQKEAR